MYYFCGHMVLPSPQKITYVWYASHFHRKSQTKQRIQKAPTGKRHVHGCGNWQEEVGRVVENAARGRQVDYRLLGGHLKGRLFDSQQAVR